MKKFFAKFSLVFIGLSLSGCYFTGSVWKMHDEKAETKATSLGKPEQLYLNLKERKICISYHPNNAADSALKYLVVNQDARPNAIGRNYDLQILKDILSNTSNFDTRYVIANAQTKEKSGDDGKCEWEAVSCESADYFIIALQGRANEGFELSKFSDHMYYTSENLIDSPLVLDKYKNEPLTFIYGAFPSNGRLWWIPTQGFSLDMNNSCDTADWVQLLSQKMQFDLYYNTSKRAQVFDNPPWAIALRTPFTVVLDAITLPVQIGIGIYIFFHGIP